MNKPTRVIDWQERATDACVRVRDTFEFDSDSYNAADVCADAVYGALRACPITSEEAIADAGFVESRDWQEMAERHDAVVAELARVRKERDEQVDALSVAYAKCLADKDELWAEVHESRRAREEAARLTEQRETLRRGEGHSVGSASAESILEADRRDWKRRATVAEEKLEHRERARATAAPLSLTDDEALMIDCIDTPRAWPRLMVDLERTRLGLHVRGLLRVADGLWHVTDRGLLAFVKHKHLAAPSSVAREVQGQLVREVWLAWAREQPNPSPSWLAWAREQPNPKPSWLARWEGLSEKDREVDRRIGETLAAWNP